MFVVEVSGPNCTKYEKTSYYTTPTHTTTSTPTAPTPAPATVATSTSTRFRARSVAQNANR